MTRPAPTPLDLLSLAELRRTDPDLALWIADQSAEAAKTNPNKDKNDERRIVRNR